MKFFKESKEEVLKELDVDPSRGLSDEEVKKRIEKYGHNQFTKQEEGSLWDDIKDAVTEPMMIILLIAAGISALIGEYHDAIGIICAISLGITIGIVTEGKSKKAAEALAKMTEDIEVKAIRGGKILQVNKSELVPGDIIMVETGDMVPADARLIESLDLKVREDMLTGESDDVSKNADNIIEMEVIESEGKNIVQDPIPAKQTNMLFGGTLVAYGRGKAVLTSTGDNTEMGKIAASLVEDDEETPLQIKLGELGGQISKISSAIAGLLFIAMVAKMVLSGALHIDTSGFMPFLDSIGPVKTAFIVCVALIVAAVPEGLPTMINMTLAITMQKMAKINALVTKKEACETIGAVSVVCSDKTGTLTQNRMTVEKVYLNGKFVEKSEFTNDNFFIDNCIVNSTADIECEGNSFKYLGSATECALLLCNDPHNYKEKRESAEIVHQIPFTSMRKRMVTIIKNGQDSVLLSKGAPEIVLSLCKYEHINNETNELTEKRRSEILSEIEKLQSQSMRILGFGYKYIQSELAEVAVDTIAADQFEENLIFTGFVGIKDPLRPEVKEAVETARKAGVQTKMLTGDNINTAVAIGKELGIVTDNMRAVEATFIDTLSDEKLREEIKTIAIVARSKPETKMRIVDALQHNGEVVAVTGDGINDAPALTKADVGVAMGIAGTEVSKNAADIILTDDSFGTIIKAIKWGRGIYENFQRFIQFQITVNIVAFLIAIVSQLTGHEMPFTTIQLLWVNIIMDGPPALALGLEPVRDKVLKRKPVNRKANIITKQMLTTIILNALYITALLFIQMNFNILGAEVAPASANGFVPNEMETVLFGIFAFSALFNAFNCREFGKDSIIPNFTKNKIALRIITITAIGQLILTEVFKDFFSAVALSPMMWLKIIGLCSTIVIVNELVKLVLRTFGAKEDMNVEGKISA